nr:helix-turn-helix domain-containing protein [Moorella sulfitireducens]
MPLVLTVTEAARLLRVGRSTAYEMANRGDIPVIKLGRRLLVRREALLKMLEAAAIKTEK